MGETTFVKPAAKPAAKPHSLRLKMDTWLLAAVLALLFFGLLMVYSSSWALSIDMGNSPHYMGLRQTLWALFGLVAGGIASIFDYHRFQRLALPIMLVAILALVVIIVSGAGRAGAIQSDTGGSIQPSEMAKLALIIYLAVWLNSKQSQINQYTFGLVPLIFILGVVAGLVFLVPDNSAALTVFILGGVLFFLANGAPRQIILVVVVAALLGWVIVTLTPVGPGRINTFMEGLRDPVNAHYQVQRTLEAIVNGGFFGVGIGRASTKFTGLPVASTDSIFAVIAEETGLVGVCAVIALFLIFMWRGFSIARRAPDLLGKLLASGITAWIMIEAVMNMMVNVNLLPQAGNSLPLISAGGSNLVTTLTAIGILMNVARSAAQETPSEGRSFASVIDLRRRDRRRRVSRPVGSTGSRPE